MTLLHFLACLISPWYVLRNVNKSFSNVERVLFVITGRLSFGTFIKSYVMSHHKQQCRPICKEETLIENTKLWQRGLFKIIVSMFTNIYIICHIYIHTLIYTLMFLPLGPDRPYILHMQILSSETTQKAFPLM